MLNIPHIPGSVWFLIFVGLALAAYLGSEWWNVRRKRAADQTAPHPAGEGAQGAKSGEGAEQRQHDESAPTATTSAYPVILTPYAPFAPVSVFKSLHKPKPKSPPKKKPAKRKKRR